MIMMQMTMFHGQGLEEHAEQENTEYDDAGDDDGDDDEDYDEDHDDHHHCVHAVIPSSS